MILIHKIMSTAVPSLVSTMQQATGGSPIPGSVARWLNELRRDTDSSEIEEELRLRVECEAVASEVELVSSPSPDVKERTHEGFDVCFHAKRVAIATSPSVCTQRWSNNPVFHAIGCHNDEQEAPTEKQRCSTTSSFKSLCKEARRASESLIENLPLVSARDVYHSASSAVNCDKRLSLDEELEQLSVKAVSIADEAIAQCATAKAATAQMAGVEAVTRVRSASAASELSDDVFFGSTSSIHSDINNIFDQGRTDDTPPVAPPRRKKSTAKPPAKEIFREIEVFTAKAIEKDIDNNDLKKMGDEVVLYSKKPCNNLTMGKDKEAVREDKTISSRPEVRARSSPHLPNDNDAAREQCNPAFAHHFSLQIVDRKTYYPAIKPGQGERISVPSLSQEVKALYLDEAAKVGENKKAASLPTAITQKRGDVTLTAAVESSVHELSADEKHAVALLDEATRDEEFSLLESTRLQIAAEESMRSRKGSFSSDIVEWKRELLQQWDRLEDEEELHCYKPGPEPEEWFSSNDREGRLYFFEQNSNESSWTLPGESIASSPNTSPTTKTPSDTTSCGSPKDKQPPASPTKPGAAVIASLRQGVVAQKTAEAERRLAAAAVATTEDKAPSGDEDGDESPEDGTASPHIRAKLPPGALLLPAYPGLRVAKTRSMVIVDNKRGSVTAGHDESKSASMPRNWPQLLEAGMAVLKEGQLNKTRLTENGKKLRKNWAPSHVVLTELFLLFFRDAKSFAAMKSGTTGGSKPEMSIDLNGAVVETGEKFSSRKNVFVVTTALGQQVLCQEDNMGDAHSWFHQVSLAIKSLPSNGNNSVQRIKCLPSREGSPQVQLPSESPPEEKNAINRTKSVKVKKDTGSVEDLTASNNNAAEQTKIKARLKKFFVRRPTMESLVKKGIWKDEPAFGSYLAKLCFDEPGLPQVPIFVQRCIATIECKPENMKTDGLYRASGNLSQVQKIRLQVDQNNLNVLDQEEDVHVLTGALKLFFRELKEPLIPYDAFNKALKASTNPNKKEKLQQFRDIIKNLPAPNHDTLKFLLQHLLRVTQEQASNRMHIPNLAIVFGPTLMWPEEESLNMALDLMQQNIVIESLLQEFDAIFR
ncbi:hypothetical protein B566_EDAN007117 [Ephemera danica]|nr:hypothetical protein B566_EDAN007117 [Ephemera danica]